MNTETKKETKKTKTKKSRKGLGIVLTLIGLIWGGLTLKGLFVNLALCQTPAKKYKLYKISINKSLHFA